MSLRREDDYREIDSLRAEVARLTAERDAAKAEADRLRAALTTIRDGFDCDADSHKYNTVCRCCLARAALGAKGAG